MTDIGDLYAQRQIRFQQTAQHLRRRYDRIALWRLLFFVAAVGLMILLWLILTF